MTKNEGALLIDLNNAALSVVVLDDWVTAVAVQLYMVNERGQKVRRFRILVYND